MSSAKRCRVTVKYKSANPLFEKWLREWKQEAAEKQSKLESTFSRALCYLRKYPLKFNTGQECKILKGFGNKLCKMLDDKLVTHNLQLAKKEGDINTLINLQMEQQQSTTKTLTNHTSTEILSKHSNEDATTETVQINTKNKKRATKKCESTITKIPSIFPDDHQESRDASIEECPKRKKNSKNIIKTISSTCSSTSGESEDFYILEPGNFDIILYVDTAETTGNSSKTSSDPLLKELQTLMGPKQFEVKKLNVGDYIWVCRDKTTQKELVLPYIFERKRLDDFAGSIKDGRYKEQKFRLKRSGIQNIFYLIEHYHSYGLPLTTLQQATFNTAIQDGFKIKMTKNLKHTASLLIQFSNILTTTFQGKTLLRCSKDNLPTVDLNDDLISLMSFKEFNQSSLKNKPMKVTDLFIKMLVQLHGVSVDRALAIVEQFPTPILLKKMYDECGDDTAGEIQLADIKCGTRKLGVALSRTIYQLFHSKSY